MSKFERSGLRSSGFTGLVTCFPASYGVFSVEHQAIVAVRITMNSWLEPSTEEWAITLEHRAIVAMRITMNSWLEPIHHHNDHFAYHGRRLLAKLSSS